jgi:hypothetical protein
MKKWVQNTVWIALMTVCLPVWSAEQFKKESRVGSPGGLPNGYAVYITGDGVLHTNDEGIYLTHPATDLYTQSIFVGHGADRVSLRLRVWEHPIEEGGE